MENRINVIINVFLSAPNKSVTFVTLMLTGPEANGRS